MNIGQIENSKACDLCIAEILFLLTDRITVSTGLEMVSDVAVLELSEILDNEIENRISQVGRMVE